MENNCNTNNAPENGNEPILTNVVSEFFEFESEAVTDPVELAKYRRPKTEDRSPPILVDRVVEFIESEGEAITDPAVLARLRPQVDPARKIR